MSLPFLFSCPHRLRGGTLPALGRKAVYGIALAPGELLPPFGCLRRAVQLDWLSEADFSAGFGWRTLARLQRGLHGRLWPRRRPRLLPRFSHLEASFIKVDMRRR